MATIVCDPLMERITDALLDMRSEALQARAERAATELTVWEVRDFSAMRSAMALDASFELGGLRPIPNSTGNPDRPFAEQWTRFADLVRQARTWNGTGIRGAVTWRTARQRQSTLRRALGRAA